jgi:type VI secretion system protein ImpA
MSDEDHFAPDTDALLAPIAGPSAGGPKMRYDPLYRAIARAREADDPSLPMGEWEHELKKADWPVAAAKCVELLSGRSKDFQVAAWLCEAWTHLHQVAGFNAGLTVLCGLAERYWDVAHPLIEDGDDDARAAPFIWMNESYPLLLTLHVPLLHLADRSPAAINLADWDQSLLVDQKKATARTEHEGEDKKPLTREDMGAAAVGANLGALLSLQADLHKALVTWERLSALLDERMQVNPPSLARIGEVLRRLERAATELIGDRAPVLQAASPQQNAAAPAATNPEVQTMAAETPVREAQAQIQEVVLNTGTIRSREEAYRLLEAVAAYLQKTEPHSPTPYLVKRAVAWGRMSLSDLMQEIVREEGDIGRFFSLLGIKDARE